MFVLDSVPFQTKRRGDQMVYNLAVMEVDRILQQGKLSEAHLVELQRNFAKGAMMPPPSETRIAHMSHSVAHENENQGPRSAATEEQGAVAIREEQTQILSQVPQPQLDTSDSVSIANSTATPGGTRRKKLVDEWSIITLYNDVAHLEEENKKKEKSLSERDNLRRTLLMQAQERDRQKKAARQAELDSAKDQVRAYEKWKQEQDAALQRKLDRREVEKKIELEERKRIQTRRKQIAEQELREAKHMIAGFQREIDEEEARRVAEIDEKNRRYQAMLADNDKELERKRQIKEAERAENQRLFEMQIARAEAEDRRRQLEEAKRQERLKKAERMAGDLNNRAAEMEAELEERVRKAQEENARREDERDRKKREAKAHRDQETARVLQEQVRRKEEERARLAEENRRVADSYRRDAEELARQQEQQRQERLAKRQRERESITQQIAMRNSKNKVDSGMSATELRMNAHLLKRVLRQAPELKEAPQIPEDLVMRIEGASLHDQNRTERA
jgi:hypothetical protein